MYCNWAVKNMNKLKTCSVKYIFFCCVLILFSAPSSAFAQKSPYLSIWDLPSDYDGSAYPLERNFEAPKGGNLALSAIGFFDSLNPFSARGTFPYILSLTYESLGEVIDRKNTVIRGVLAENFELNEDRSVLKVYLKDAKFSDNSKVDAHDVVATFNALTTQASPIYSELYKDVIKVYAESDKLIVYEFSENKSRDLPLDVCLLPVFPAEFLKNNNLGEPSRESLIGSGPYRVKDVEFGVQLILERRDDYWAKDLSYNQGRYNFDTVTTDYFRDAFAARQAFLAGELDYYSESSIKDWLYSYDTDAVKDGRITKLASPHDSAIGMMGIIFNTRKTLLADKNVRHAISLLFDFEWINKSMLHNSVTRCTSYFTRHDFDLQVKPTPAELELLLPYKDQLDPAVFGDFVTMPITDASGNVREQMRQAVKLLKKSGWELKNGIMQDKEGNPLKLTFVSASAVHQKNYASFQENLKRIGIDLTIQLLDQNQYVDKVRNFDYDLMYTYLSQSSNPGNEQRNYWSSEAADRPSSRNYAGIKSPVVDMLVEKLIAATSREEMKIAANALNRVLMHGYYAIPTWYQGGYRKAWWKDKIHGGTNLATKTPTETWYRVQ